MNYLIVRDSPPYDGRYEWDMEGRPFNTREWGWVTNLTGYLPLDIEFGDPRVILAFAVIAIRRAGRITNEQVPAVYDQLSDVPFGDQVELETGEGTDAGPPDISSSSSNGSSGDDSSTSSAKLDSPAKASGMLASGFSESGPARLTT